MPFSFFVFCYVSQVLQKVNLLPLKCVQESGCEVCVCVRVRVCVAAVFPLSAVETPLTNPAIVTRI